MHSLMRLLLLSLCLSSIALAHAPMGLPEVSFGTNPHRSFSGAIERGTTIPLIDVPADQEFIVTMVATREPGSLVSDGELRDDGIRVLQDSSIILSGSALGPGRNTSITHNNGRLRVSGGTSLSIESGSTSAASSWYHVQGHFVHSNSPYRSIYGVTPSGTATLHTVFTNTESHDFMIRTVILRAEGGGINDCDLYIDGTLVVDGTSTYASVNYTNSIFPMGKAAIILSSDSAIQIMAVDPKTCQYYIEGEYIHP